MTYNELISCLAQKYGLTDKRVKKLARALVKFVVTALEDDGEVKIGQFGTFRRMELTVRGVPQVKVKFTTTRAFRSRYKRRTEQTSMDKYGVKIDQDKAKKARVTGRCPDCGSDLEKDHEKIVLLCPHCGTKPWEPEV